MAAAGSGKAGPPDARAALQEVLAESQRRGLIGPRPIEVQIGHSEGFAAAITWACEAPRQAEGLEQHARVGSAAGTPGRRVLDLGAGGGLPGLVLAARFPVLTVVLLDASQRRIRFLEWAIERLNLPNPPLLVHERAEVAGRDPLHRGRYTVVVSRSFGPPGPTAECAAPFLEVGGVLVVSEPPVGEAADERWPAESLAALEMSPPVRYGDDPQHFVVIRQESGCPERYPRRVGVPAKRPLF